MEQTNRTILFEEINPEKDDLLTLIGDVRNKHSLTDEDINKINEKLLIQSFEEFLDKFEPRIYGMVDTQRMTFMFAKENMWKNENTFCIDISEKTSFFQSLFSMLDKHHGNGTFHASLSQDVLKVLRADEVQNCSQLIKQVKEEFLYGEKKNAQLLLKQIVEKYDQGIVCLQVLLEKMPKQIDKISEPISNPLVLKQVQGTQIEVMKLSTEFQEYEFRIEEERREEYIEFINSFLEERKRQEQEIKNEDCLLLCLLQGAFSEEQTGYLIEKYQLYQDFYAKVIQVFWNELRPLLQHIIGIYSFFQQYTVEEAEKTDAMKPTMIVTNCSVEAIQNVEYKERLIRYLETVNDKTYSNNAIWYAVVPGLAYQKEELQERVRERFQSISKEQKELFHKEIAHDEEYVKEVTTILTQYQIISFLSIAGKKSTSFVQFVKDGIQNYNDTFMAFSTMEHKEYIVPCLPNFTIIPREFMEVSIGETYQYDEFSMEGVVKGEKRTLWMEGLYVEASYVAAGLTAAWQCPYYLNQYHRGKVNMELPGVAYRIADEDNYTKTKTTMRREVLYCGEELREDIERRSHGVVFVPHRNGVVMATDRCMAFQNGSNDCISTVQTLVYMERILRHETQDFKAAHIKTFFQNRPDSVKSKWYEKRKTVNAMIKENEDLTYKLDEDNNTCIFEMDFKEISKSRKVTTSN